MQRIDEYAEALLMAFEESREEDRDLVIDNLLSILGEAGELELYPEIVEQFEKLLLARQQQREVEVSTMPVSSIEDKEVVEKLNEVLGGNLEIRTRTDDSLIGGVVVRVDDMEVDASIRGRLNNMEDELTR